MNNLFVYLPCYNEEGNIQNLIEEWLKEKDLLSQENFALKIIPIDDKSTDNTLQIIQHLETIHEEVHVIAHSKNKNLGGALLTAITDFLNRTSESSNDLLCFMDGDNTHKPRFVHSMIDKINKGTDCVIASRYQPGSVIQGVPFNRSALSDCAKLFYSSILRIPNVKDYTCGYRLYTHAILVRAYSRYQKNLITMRSFSCMMELLYKLYLSGCTFDEIPFTLYYDSKSGTSKMRIAITIKDSLLTALRLRLLCN